jgi:Na+/proline symporter
LTNRRAKIILTCFIGAHVALACIPTALNLYGSSDPTLSIVGRITDRAWVFVFHLITMPTLIFGLPILAIMLLVALTRNPQ